MVVELQLVLHTIAEVPQHPNVLDRPFVQGSMLSRPAGSLCIHDIIFLIVVLLCSSSSLSIVLGSVQRESIVYYTNQRFVDFQKHRIDRRNTLTNKRHSYVTLFGRIKEERAGASPIFHDGI